MALNVKIGGLSYNNVKFPIKLENQLDEQLDQARLSMQNAQGTTADGVFPIGAEVEITATDENGNTVPIGDFIIAADEASFTAAQTNPNVANHEILCIEPTKILEGEICDTLTFTNNLGRRYDGNPRTADPDYT